MFSRDLSIGYTKGDDVVADEDDAVDSVEELEVVDKFLFLVGRVKQAGNKPDFCNASKLVDSDCVTWSRLLGDDCADEAAEFGD